MIKASKFAIAIALAGALAVATVGETFAAPVLTNAVAVKAAAPAAPTNMQYWAYDYGYGRILTARHTSTRATPTGTPPIPILGTTTGDELICRAASALRLAPPIDLAARPLVLS